MNNLPNISVRFTMGNKELLNDDVIYNLYKLSQEHDIDNANDEKEKAFRVHLREWHELQSLLAELEENNYMYASVKFHNIQKLEVSDDFVKEIKAVAIKQLELEAKDIAELISYNYFNFSVLLLAKDI